MNYTITESQLDDLNKKIDDLKDLIKSTISPEFKVGDYVYIEKGGSGASGCNGEYGQITDDEAISGCCYREHGENAPKVKLLNGLKVWALNPESMSIRKVDEKEIEDYVLQEAKRRGLEIGARFKSVDNEISTVKGFDFWNSEGTDTDIEWRFNLSGNPMSGAVLFRPRQGWATPIKEKVLSIGEAVKLLNKLDENFTHSIRH